MKLAALAALVLVGCASYTDAPPSPAPTPVPPASWGCDRAFAASADFLPGERAALERAAARWNEVAVEQFCVVDGDGQQLHGIWRIEVGSPEWQHITSTFGGEFYGIHLGNTDRIGIVSGLEVSLFELVALHEFGHAHGLDHTEPPSLMCSWVGSADDFTPIDIAECKRVGACK